MSQNMSLVFNLLQEGIIWTSGAWMVENRVKAMDERISKEADFI